MAVAWDETAPSFIYKTPYIFGGYLASNSFPGRISRMDDHSSGYLSELDAVSQKVFS